MGYNVTAVRRAESQLNSYYDTVEASLKSGHFIAGPGVNVQAITGIPPRLGQSAFGGPDPYARGAIDYSAMSSGGGLGDLMFDVNLN